MPNPSNPQNLNRYTYVRNSPVRYADSTGRYIDVDAARQGTLRYMDETGQKVIYERAFTDEERIAQARARRRSAPIVASPVDAKYPVTGPFGGHGSQIEDYHYINDKGERVNYYHPGLDYGVPESTDLYATRDGVVVAAGDFGGYGWGVVIWHPDEKAYTAYYHMQEKSLLVVPGDVVLAGDCVGKSSGTPKVLQSDGTYKNKFAPHLHFEVVRENALIVDRGKGTFSYRAGYYPLTAEALWASRMSPVEWLRSR